MARFNDLATAINSALPGWPCVEFYRERADKCVVVRAVQGGRSDENTRRFVYQLSFMGGANDTAEDVEQAAELVAKHFLDNHRAGGVLLITVIRDVMGPFWSDEERPYYNFEISIINSSN